jgi:hypothetical protein
MFFCNIENNVILTAPRQLPIEINVDNAVAQGWYPVIFLNMPHLLTCNTLTEIMEMRTRISGTTVECWYDIVQKSADNIEQTRILLLGILRNERTQKLLYCDWTQLPNAPLTEEKIHEWNVYRQMLRDLPAIADLGNIVWPVAPTN